MSTLYLLIPIAALLVIIAIGLFLWSIKSGQFEDLEGPGFKMLMDDDDDMIPEEAKKKSAQAAPLEKQAENQRQDKADG